MQISSVTVVGLIVTSLFAAWPAASFADEAELEQLRSENAALRQRVAQLEARLSQLTGEKQELEKEHQQVVAEVQQAQTARRAEYVSVRFDADDNRSSATTRVSGLNVTVGPPRHHWLNFEASWAGREATAGRAKVELRIDTKFSGGIYRKVDDIMLWADGNQIAAKVIDYDTVRRSFRSPRGVTRKDDETIIAELSSADLHALAAANQVTGRIGSTSFELSAEQRRMLGALAEVLR